mgnify:FL=1
MPGEGPNFKHIGGLKLEEVCVEPLHYLVLEYLIVTAFIFLAERINQAIAFPSYHQGFCIFNPKELGSSKTVAILYKFIIYEDACSTSC